MILSIPRTLGGGCSSAAAILVALLIASESGGCSGPHSSSSSSCGSFFGISGVDAFTLPTSRTIATPLYSSYLDSITASVVPSKKKSYSPSSSSIGKSNAAAAGADSIGRTCLPDDIYYDGRSDDGALLRQWLSDPTNVRALARRAHFDISPGNIGATGLPDDDRRGYGDIAAEERQIGKWAAYLTDPAVSNAMANMALDDKLTYFADDFAAGDISDEYRVLTSLKDYLTDPSSARALISSALDGVPTALPDDSPFSQGNDAATVFRKWLDADPDNARRALVGFAASMDDKLGYLSDDMAAHAALPGYESVDQVLGRYRNDPTTIRKAANFGGAASAAPDDGNIGEALKDIVSAWLSDPTNAHAALQEMGVDGNGLLPDDIEYSADEAGLLWLYKYLTDGDGRLNLSQWLSTDGNLERILSDDKWSLVPDDDSRDLGYMSVQSRWGGNDPTNPTANRDAYASGVETPKGFSLYYGSGTNMKRVSSASNDKLKTMYPDDKFYLPGYESPKDTLGRYASDPTTFKAKARGYEGLETPKNSLYYGRHTSTRDDH